MPLSVTTMNQVRVTWAGFPGGPGVSTFYTDGASTPNVAAVRTFFATLAGFFPSNVTLTFPSAGESISPEDGTLEGSWSIGTPPAALSGSTGGSYTAAQGCQVSWLTDEIADGHAVRGRTFIVPTMTGIFGPDGLITATTQTALQSAATALRGSTPHFVVWHRPKKGPKPAGGGPRPIIRPGGWAQITGNSSPRTPVVLTSRRD
jgi:hypothetical protein